MNTLALWRRYKQYQCQCPELGFSLDISRMKFDDSFFDQIEPMMQNAYSAMRDLEAGDITNPDEQRMVGHYWLRAPHLAPNDDIAHAIEHTIGDIQVFADQVHGREIAPPTSAKFTDVVIIGIGGSSLGPQLVADAMGTKRDKMAISFLDNTDPDGIDRLVASLGVRLKSTLVVVISKSGGTKETRNSMLEMRAAFTNANLDFAQHAVAVTSDGSLLYQLATKQNWLKIFPMWDWVGGRTSVLSAVGLLPAALQGLDIQGLLEGAAVMDKITRQPNTKNNPAALMAMMWHYATGGRGSKDLVILPYKDRLLLLSRYLQQLIMESLGKELDLDGQTVNQGLAVYGNKGSTDQHAYVQQLRDGVNNFFVNFLVVLQDRTPTAAKKAIEVDAGVMAGDYLNGFWQGTRQALYENGRESITVTIEKLDAHALGCLIALYERAVGFYATMVNINAYHQPGVEAGKKAAASILELQSEIAAWFKTNTETVSPEQVADRMGKPHDVEAIFHILEHLAINKRLIKRVRGKYRSLK